MTLRLCILAIVIIVSYHWINVCLDQIAAILIIQHGSK